MAADGYDPRPLRLAATSFADELDPPPSERRYDELAALGAEVRHLVGTLVRDARSGDARAYETACGESLDLVLDIWEQARPDPAALAAADLEPELSDLVALVARLRVAARLDGVAIRETAAEAGVAPSYLSELRSVKKGLPSSDVAARLDQVLGVPDGQESLLEVVSRAKAMGAEIVAEARGRSTAVTTASGSVIPHDLRGIDRLNEVAEALRTDEVLLTAVERLVALRGRERRAVVRLLDELASTE